MILRSDRFDEKVSPYDRPNFPYRCGRAAAWRTPCHIGPNVDGSCGGVTECQPYNENGRWVCRRPASAGGPCTEGPMPDGGCAHNHPACQPRRTLRKIRGRLAVMAAAIVISAIAAFGFSFGGESDLASSLDAGPLTSVHQNFAAEGGCGTCHEAHGSGPSGWIKAVFSSGSPAGKCADCHQFKGEAHVAHNAVPAQNVRPIGTECTMCHTEHKGIDASITTVSDAQCHTCHKAKFTAFAGNHPEFSKTYPFRRRTAIAFNHSNHFDKHFKDQRYVKKVPAGGCIGCHEPEKAERVVPIRGFDKTCSGCHLDNITSRPLTVFTFPELEQHPFDLKEILEKRGLFPEDREAALERIHELTEKLASGTTAVITASAAELRVAPLHGVVAGKKAATQALADQLKDKVSGLAGQLKKKDEKEVIAKLLAPVTTLSEEAHKALATLSAERLEKLVELAESLKEVVEEFAELSATKENIGRFNEIKQIVDHFEERVAELEEDEEYEPVSTETFAPVMAGLLQIDGEEPEDYKDPTEEWVNASVSDGAAALADVIEKDGGDPNLMLHGLSNELITSAATAWASNREYEAVVENNEKGWYATELSLVYKAPAHADPVMKAWLTFAAEKGNETLKNALLSRRDGPGACTKCHAVSLAKGEKDAKSAKKEGAPDQLLIEWPSFENVARPFVKYLHKPHINLLGPGSWCTTCHKMNKKAEFDAAYSQFDPLKFASNFESVGKSTCVECHGGGQVSQTCQLCHTYHQEPGFKKGMLRQVATNRQ